MENTNEGTDFVTGNTKQQVIITQVITDDDEKQTEPTVVPSWKVDHGPCRAWISGLARIH